MVFNIENFQLTRACYDNVILQIGYEDHVVFLKASTFWPVPPVCPKKFKLEESSSPKFLCLISMSQKIIDVFLLKKLLFFY